MKKALAKFLRKFAQKLEPVKEVKPAQKQTKHVGIIRDLRTGKIYGVNAEARRLGISAGHLSLVLNGKRQSKRLMKRVQIKEVK